ncbi:hypothetical protein D3C86_2078080 [compost metagenome]
MNRRMNTRLKIMLRLPAKLIRNFRGINPITTIMSWTIFDEMHQRLGFSKLAKNRLDNLNVRSLIISTDIINLTTDSMM